MESFCTIIFTLILVFPLIMQLQMLIADPKKLCTLFHYYATSIPEDTNQESPELLQYYRKEPIAFANSSSKMSLTNLRTVSSSPVLHGSLSIPEDRPAKPIEVQLSETRHSSTFVKTGLVLPVVDIGWNYSSLRYKAFEACLRDHYGNKYPPGEVVLNSMQLNLLDSSTSMSLATAAAGLFDFVKESDLPLDRSVSRKLEIEYLNPLDHFVTKQLDRPPTAERFTETLCEQEDEVSARDANREEDAIRPVINGREKNGRINRRSPRKIELLRRKCNLSPTRRVYETRDFQPRRRNLTEESLRAAL